MKKQLLLFIAFCLSLQVIHAQTVDFVFTVKNAHSSSSCDGEMNVQCTGCISPVNYIWYDSASNIIGTNSYISGLCSNSFYVVVINDATEQIHQFSSRIFNATQMDSVFQINTSLHYATDTASNHLIVPQILGGIAPYTYQLFANFFGSNILVNNATVNSVSNLLLDNLTTTTGDDYYRFNLIDSSNYRACYFFSMLQNTDFTNSSLYASAQGSPVSDSSTCDGTAYTEVYGGTPPYTYQYSSGSTSDTANGLCPGSYIVTVTDADSNVFNTSFVIGYPNTYYYSGDSYNYLDTLYSNALQDCGIDYNLPVDSFYIDSAYALSNWEYVVNWTIVQDSNEFLFTETYFIDSTGYYYFGLSLYCDEAQRVSSNFASYTFFVGAYADISNSPTQIQDISLDNSIAVYPNPSNGIFTITSSKKMTTYSIFDALGRKVLSKSTDSTTQSIDIQTLNTGMYYLMVQFEDGTIGKQKLIKK